MLLPLRGTHRHREHAAYPEAPVLPVVPGASRSATEEDAEARSYRKGLRFVRTMNAIVVEGGAMRGVFAAGVLDFLLEQGLDEPDLAIGASAGACNLASFLARQHGRNLRCYTKVMTRKEMFSLRRALRGGHYMDLDWLWDELARQEPLDEQTLAARRTAFVSVATCVNTGVARYLTHEPPFIHAELKGGCALPMLYRGPVRIREHSVVDGGIVDPIPVVEAYRRGARRIVVIRSRPHAVVKQQSPLDPVVSALLSKRPHLARAARKVAHRYQQAVGFLQKPPDDLALLHLAPEQPLRTTRTSRNSKDLHADYELGRRMAKQHLPQLEALLT